jgi:AcrR family transcriptional regulator
MDLKQPAVKPKRNYDVSRRRRRAEESRARILDSARRLFLSEGYVGTTVSRIADDADVSVETIYKAFGGKAGLVRSLWQRALEGSGDISAERRSDEMRVRETDPRKIIENWGRFTTEVAPLIAPIVLLARSAAAADPELARVLEQAEAARIDRMEHNARDLLERGYLRPGVTLDEARDVLWAYSSAELYELLVIRRGWQIDRFGRFVASGMIAALLPQEDGDR